MAIKVIRSNNYKDVAAYDDATLFYMSKGKNGVIVGVYEEFNSLYDYNLKKIVINSGMGIVYGRQFVISPGEQEFIDLSTLTNKSRGTVYLSLDTRDPSNEIATIKTVTSIATADYPVVANGDDLIVKKQGVANMTLFHFDYIDASTVVIGGIESSIKILANEIENAKYLLSSSGSRANLTTSYQNIKTGSASVIPNANAVKLYVEDCFNTNVGVQKTIFNSSDGLRLHLENSKDFVIELLESVQLNDIIEIEINSTLNVRYIFRMRLVSYNSDFSIHYTTYQELTKIMYIHRVTFRYTSDLQNFRFVGGIVQGTNGVNIMDTVVFLFKIRKITEAIL